MAIITIVLCAALSSCGSGGNNNSNSVKRLIEQNDSLLRQNAVLQERLDRVDSLITEITEKNKAQDANIKDVEDDLEGVITFMNNEFNY